MNTRTPLESPSSTVVLSISFNDDCSCFAVGLNTGFCSKSPPTPTGGNIHIHIYDDTLRIPRPCFPQSSYPDS